MTVGTTTEFVSLNYRKKEHAVPQIAEDMTTLS
jgi:hypothetical protein